MFSVVFFFFFLLFHPSKRTEGGDNPDSLTESLLVPAGIVYFCDTAGPVFHTMGCNVVYRHCGYFSDLHQNVFVKLVSDTRVSFPPC